MKRAVLVASPDILRKLLQLPDEAIVTDIRVPFYNPGMLEIAIEGAGWETPEGAAIMRAPVGQICTTWDYENFGRLTIDWGLSGKTS